MTVAPLELRRDPSQQLAQSPYAMFVLCYNVTQTPP